MAEAMKTLHFDESALVRDLGRVGRNSRVAFAAACAERLLPAYEAFCRRAGRGDPDALAGILDRTWRHLLGEAMSSDEIRAELQRCIELIPGEDDEPWVDEQPYADDAASAIAYTVRALDTGEPQEAAWAARRAYDAADHHVIRRLAITVDSLVLAHPIVQAEISRQRRDLEQLTAASQQSAELFVRFRDRARAESATFFSPSALS